jgi:hypothetical protein
MAISGGAKPSVEMQVIAGELVIGSQAMRQGVVNDVDLAVQRLACGERVFVQQYGDLPERVRKTVQMMLGGN